jgi:hypothetical protein
VADSLVVAETIELLGGGVLSGLPQCPDASLILQPGYSLGSPQTVTDLIAALATDGERPYGHRASNRKLQLPVKITAPDRDQLAAAREALLQATDAQTWTLTYTHDGGDPFVLDCYRAEPADPDYDLDTEQQGIEQIRLNFEATPYGHARSPVEIDFPSPSAGWITPPAPVTLDDFSVLSTSTQTGRWTASAAAATGSHSAFWHHHHLVADPFYAIYTRALSPNKDLTGLPVFTFWLGLGTVYYDTRWHSGNMTFKVILTDNVGGTLTCSLTRHVDASDDIYSPRWQLVSLNIPQVASGFDYAHVASYQVTAWHNVTSYGYDMDGCDLYLCQVVATPIATKPVAATRGALYNLVAQGTARAPMSTRWQAPPVSIPQTQTWATTGVYAFTVPAGVYSLKIRAKGATGAGGQRTTTGLGGGAGGGAGVGADNYPVTPGQQIVIFVGAAGTDGATPADGGATGVDGNMTAGFAFGAPGGKSVPPNTAAGGLGGQVDVCSLPGGNVLTGDAGNFETGTGGWQVSGGTCTLARSTAQPRSGAGALALTCTAAGVSAGAMNALSGGTGVGTGLACAQGDQVSAVIPARAATAGRNVSGVLSWYGVSGWISNTVGTAVPDVTTGYVLAYVNGTAPAGATMCYAQVSVAAAALGEVHYTDDPQLRSGLALPGGNGYTATSGGGGAGSSAGDDLPGVNATSSTGATAPAGGISGGNGGAAGGNNPGGTPGGGACSTGSTVAGGAGAAGKVQFWWTQVLQPFNTLVVHAPGYDAPDTLSPLISVGNGADPADSREYPITSPVAGSPARFKGTYSGLLVANTLDTPSTSRKVTVSINQYDYSGGPVTTGIIGGDGRTFIPNAETLLTGCAGGLVTMGEITLPLRDIADDNGMAYYTAEVLDTNALDRWLDLILLDVTGQTLILVSPGSGWATYYLDEPTAALDFGRVLGSAFGRGGATSVIDSVMILSGGPMVLDPGGNLVLGWSLAGAPAVQATYKPRFWLDTA